MRAVLLAIVVVAVAAMLASAAPSPAVIAYVTDGDTVRLADGRRVRLVQIDTPEVGTGECYSRAARKALVRLAPGGSAVGLEADARLDQIDRYGRLLRYLWRGSTNVNLELVRGGRRISTAEIAAATQTACSRLRRPRRPRGAGFGVRAPARSSIRRARWRHARRIRRQLEAWCRAAAAIRRIRRSASHPIRRISTVPTCRTSASRSSVPTRTASTATATASAARRSSKRRAPMTRV